MTNTPPLLHAGITDTDGLHPSFHPYYVGPHPTRRPRLRVETVYRDDDGTPTHSHMRTGTVGRSTGWRPVYLLMSRADSRGSSDVISPDTGRCTTRVVGVMESPGHYRQIAEPVGPWTIGHHKLTN